MSSPIHHAEDLDEALHYAPPWAREQGVREPLRPAAALVRSPPSRWRIGVTDDAFSGDRAMVKLQRQLALDPDAVPEPPVDDIQSLWPMALRLCAVAGVAAAVAWLVISLPGARLLHHDTVHADIQVPPPVADTPKQDPLRTPAAAGLLLQHGLSEANASPTPAEAMPAPVPQPVIALTSSDAAVAPPVSLSLASDEIAMLLKRGKDAFSTGDLAAARLLLRRAAEGGSAEAALALGATFDPLILRRLGAIGAAPDAAQARQWYQKAVALGSTTASQPLAQLEAAAQ
ncbi:MAG: hypothetical protein WB764_12310 [Xanthobacteraceae bacterium]